MKITEVIVEADGRPTKSKVKSPHKDQPKEFEKAGDLARPEKKEQKPSGKPTFKTSVADKEETSRRLGQARPSQEKLDRLKDVKINADEIEPDVIDDDEAAAFAHQTTGHDTPKLIGPEKVTPKNLPAVISTAMTQVRSKTDVEGVHVKWHMVRNLPGYLSNPIRSLGRKVFSPFTHTAIEDINVIADLGGGPNTKAEIEVIARFLKAHGKRDKSAEIKFEKIIEGYEATVVVYNCAGGTFMLVKDFMGEYVYSWPEKDNKTLHSGAVGYLN